METQTKQFLKYLILPLLILAVVVFVAHQKSRPDFLLHVNFLDVGQGDSIFIQTSQGNQIMIDGGPSDKVLSELGKKIPFWDRTIDMLILTHPDSDHVSGFIDVLKRYRVEKILMTKVETPTATFEEFKKLANLERAEIIYAHQGQRIWLDSATVFDTYYPPPGIETQGLSTNNSGIFGKLTFGKTKILLTADVDSIVEDVVRNQYNIDSDILKVGHHGSKNSTSAEFVAAVSPKIAVIQVGAENNYGHPTKEAVDNLKSSGAEIFRTDLDKLVEFVSDGTSIYKK